MSEQSVAPPQSISPADRSLLFNETPSTSVGIFSHAPACPSPMVPTTDVRHTEDDAELALTELDLFNNPSTDFFSRFRIIARQLRRPRVERPV